MTTLADLARVLPFDLADWQKAVASRVLGLDLEADVDQIGHGRRCGWYPHRPRRVRGRDTRP